MTVLVGLYERERATGVSHLAALRHLARRLAVDPDTVARQLHAADPRKFPLARPKEMT